MHHRNAYRGRDNPGSHAGCPAVRMCLITDPRTVQYGVANRRRVADTPRTTPLTSGTALSRQTAWRGDE